MLENARPDRPSRFGVIQQNAVMQGHDNPADGAGRQSV